MHAGSTLFLDVCTQRDFWPGGAWPIVGDEEAQCMAELFTLAATLGVRQGGVVCMHAAASVSPVGAVHCLDGTAGAARASGCDPARPTLQIDSETALATLGTLDREHAYYVASGCAGAPDATPSWRRIFDHLTVGVRDAVVFGAGIEYGLDHTVDALLRRRIRTHVVLDAAASADAAAAQRIVADWKRRTVDGVTTIIMRRLLTRL